MGRKKIPGSSHYEAPFELKPFCYYCDREFDSIKTLIQHQRTKHLCCAECGLKFDTITGLRVHMLNAYKKTMKEVPGAMPGRENPDIVVHGMDGVPKTVIEERTRKAMDQRTDRAERAAEKGADRGEREERSERREKRAAREEDVYDEDEEEEKSAKEPASRNEQFAEPSTRAPPPPPQQQAQKQPQQPRSAQQPQPQQQSRSHGQHQPPQQKSTQAHAKLASSPQAAAHVMPSAEQLNQAVAAIMSDNLVAGPGTVVPGVSAAVARLLAGDGTAENEPAAGAGSARHVPGFVVPPAMSGLHPVALKVLARGGALSTSPAAEAARVSSRLGGTRGLEHVDKRPRLAAS